MVRPGWNIQSWHREHATHGTFIVYMLDDGKARASRVTLLNNAPWVEDLSPCDPFDNFALALIACEARIAELDTLLFQAARNPDVVRTLERVA